MAGLGRKTFAAGEVLRAADVNGYLMDQAVMTFAGTAARGSAIGTASEGMVSYLADSNNIEVYTGSDWQAPYGLTLLATQSFSGVSGFSIDNIFSSKYKNYRILFKQSYSSGTADIALRGRVAGVTTNGGWYTGLFGIGYTGTSLTYRQQVFANYGIIAATVSAQSGRVFSVIDLFNPNVADTKHLSINAFVPDSSLTGYAMDLTTPQWDGFNIQVTSGTFNGSVEVYGYRKG